MGRYRRLPGIWKKESQSHCERAAINTPLQGGAADIVMKAMVMLAQNSRLKNLGWRQLLQIHDELILEGPEQTASEAKDIVVKVMAAAGDDIPLLVDLSVSAKVAKTWYEGK
eukprot:TRINITY_DN1214_c0_g1_i1.p2 TRINITY_DN1214_c0_g1~~TRINITY_DN1214_c0_g1_i1.p2  ORF type:complete len:112 (+),score=25.80 TRINITY_DN1214_c0_g1_i1:752-1087(+)